MAARLHRFDRTAVPRRTRSSTQTTAIRPPLKRVAPTEETPTLPLTPIEVDSLVQGAQTPSVVPADAATRPTVETFRPALGSTPIPTVRHAAIAPAAAAAPADRPAATPGPPPEPAPAVPSAAPTRGPRRTRETLRADAFRPPTRKR
jgi:hypothetical protein